MPVFTLQGDYLCLRDPCSFKGNNAQEKEVCALILSFTYPVFLPSRWSTSVDPDTKDMSQGEWPIRLKMVFVRVFVCQLAVKCRLQAWSELTDCDCLPRHNLCSTIVCGGMNSTKTDILNVKVPLLSQRCMGLDLSMDDRNTSLLKLKNCWIIIPWNISRDHWCQDVQLQENVSVPFRYIYNVL